MSKHCKKQETEDDAWETRKEQAWMKLSLALNEAKLFSLPYKDANSRTRLIMASYTVGLLTKFFGSEDTELLIKMLQVCGDEDMNDLCTLHDPKSHVGEV